MFARLARGNKVVAVNEGVRSFCDSQRAKGPWVNICVMGNIVRPMSGARCTGAIELCLET